MTSTDMMLILSDYLKKTFFKLIENKYKICINHDWDEWIKSEGTLEDKPPQTSVKPQASVKPRKQAATAVRKQATSTSTTLSPTSFSKKKGLPRKEQEPIQIMDLKLYDSDKALKDKYKVAKLKALCEERGLPKSGTREQLRLSLIDYEQQFQKEDTTEEAETNVQEDSVHIETIGIIEEEEQAQENPLMENCPPQPVLAIIEKTHFDVVDLHPDYNKDYYFVLFKGTREVKGYITDWDGQDFDHVDVFCNIDKVQIKCLKSMGLEYILPTNF